MKEEFVAFGCNSERQFRLPSYIFLFVLLVRFTCSSKCSDNVLLSFSSFHLIVGDVVDIRWQLWLLTEQSQRTGSEKLAKRQCQALYPDGNDSKLFFEIEEKLGSLDKAETLLVLCKYDFTLARSIAEEAASLFHCNMKLLKSLCKEFGENISDVLKYLRKFKEQQQQQQQQRTTYNNSLLQCVKGTDVT